MNWWLIPLYALALLGLVIGSLLLFAEQETPDGDSQTESAAPGDAGAGDADAPRDAPPPDDSGPSYVWRTCGTHDVGMCDAREEDGRVSASLTRDYASAPRLPVGRYDPPRRSVRRSGPWEPPNGMPREGALSLMAVRELVSRHWPASEVDTAICVAWHESRFRIAPVHEAGDPHGGSSGLFQINGFWERGAARWWVERHGLYDRALGESDPEYHASYARAIWGEEGWWPWSTYRKYCLGGVMAASAQPDVVR